MQDSSSLLALWHFSHGFLCLRKDCFLYQQRYKCCHSTELYCEYGGENTVNWGLSTDHLDLDLKLQSMKSPTWVECIFNFVKPWARGKESSSSEKAGSLASKLQKLTTCSPFPTGDHPNFIFTPFPSKWVTTGEREKGSLGWGAMLCYSVFVIGTIVC